MIRRVSDRKRQANGNSSEKYSHAPVNLDTNFDSFQFHTPKSDFLTTLCLQLSRLGSGNHDMLFKFLFLNETMHDKSLLAFSHLLSLPLPASGPPPMTSTRTRLKTRRNSWPKTPDSRSSKSTIGESNNPALRCLRSPCLSDEWIKRVHM